MGRHEIVGSFQGNIYSGVSQETRVEEFEEMWKNQPYYYQRWFVTCKIQFEHFLCGRTYRIGDKQYDGLQKKLKMVELYDAYGASVWIELKELKDKFLPACKFDETNDLWGI